MYAKYLYYDWRHVYASESYKTTGSIMRIHICEIQARP
jgi:hypothetical protein